MSDSELRLVYGSAREAGEAYFSGIRHGLVTADISPPPAEGTDLEITIELTFADEALQVQGTVVHTGPTATVIRLADVPSELHLLMGSLEDERSAAPSSSPDTISDYQITGDHAPEEPDAEQTLVTQVPSDLLEDDEAPEAVSRIPAPPAAIGVADEQRPEAGLEESPISGNAEGRIELRIPVGRETLEGRVGIPVPHEPDVLLPGVARFRTDFTEVSPSSAFLRIHVERLTGVGVILVEDGRYWLYVLDGSPVHYLREPPLVESSTATLLMRNGLLPDAVLDQVKILATLTARPLTSVVMRLGLVTEAQMIKVRREQARLTTADLLRCVDGSLRFYEFPEVRDVFSSTAVNVVELLWQSASEAFAGVDAEEARELIEALDGRMVSLTEVGKRVLHELPLEGNPREFLNRLTRPTRQVGKLLKRAKISAPVAVRLLLSLDRMGVISMAGGDGESSLERHLRTRFARLEQDHFDLLDLHWSALPEEIRSACDALERDLREFDRSGGEFEHYAELRTALLRRTTDIRALSEEEDELAAYVAGLAEEDERDTAAEIFLKQAEMALFRKDAQQARTAFRRVLAVDPGLPTGVTRRDRAEQALASLSS